MKFGPYSQRLRHAIARLAEWLSNDNPPWAAYRAFMAGRLISLVKYSGARPMAIGGDTQCGQRRSAGSL